MIGDRRRGVGVVPVIRHRVSGGIVSREVHNFAVMVPSLAVPLPFTDARMVMVCGVDGAVQRTHASWLSPSG